VHERVADELIVDEHQIEERVGLPEQLRIEGPALIPGHRVGHVRGELRHGGQVLVVDRDPEWLQPRDVIGRASGDRDALHGWIIHGWFPNRAAPVGSTA
jgi:hypothetical protein